MAEIVEAEELVVPKVQVAVRFVWTEVAIAEVEVVVVVIVVIVVAVVVEELVVARVVEPVTFRCASNCFSSRMYSLVSVLARYGQCLTSI